MAKLFGIFILSAVCMAVILAEESAEIPSGPYRPYGFCSMPPIKQGVTPSHGRVYRCRFPEFPPTIQDARWRICPTPPQKYCVLP